MSGPPACRREFSRNDSPAGPDDFDSWVIRTALNPETPLFREGRYLLAEEPGTRDGALYHAVMRPAWSQLERPSTALICFSAAGFTNELRNRAGEDASILLVSAEELYGFPSPKDA